MVVDPSGTPAQLATRGASHWAGTSFADLVDRELATLASLGLTADSTQVGAPLFLRHTQAKRWGPGL